MALSSISFSPSVPSETPETDPNFRKSIWNCPRRFCFPSWLRHRLSNYFQTRWNRNLDKKIALRLEIHQIKVLLGGTAPCGTNPKTALSHLLKGSLHSRGPTPGRSKSNKYMGIILCLKGKFHNTKIYSYFCMELDTSRDCFKAFNFQRLRQFGFCPEYRTSHLIFFVQKHQFLFWRRSGYG